MTKIIITFYIHYANFNVVQQRKQCHEQDCMDTSRHCVLKIDEPLNNKTVGTKSAHSAKSLEGIPIIETLYAFIKNITISHIAIDYMLKSGSTFFCI